MEAKKIEAFFDPLNIVIIISCFVVGGLYMSFSKKIDAPMEQVAEAVLEKEGINIDFSAEKKAELAPEQANKAE